MAQYNWDTVSDDRQTENNLSTKTLIWDPENDYSKFPKNRTISFYNTIAVVHPKAADVMANKTD